MSGSTTVSLLTIRATIYVRYVDGSSLSGRNADYTHAMALWNFSRNVSTSFNETFRGGKSLTY